MSEQVQTYPLVKAIKQSPPIDFSIPFQRSWIKGKTIIITGGASGFGEAFLRDWAAAGANVIIGDIQVQKGDQLVREVKRETKNEHLHFIHCDVTNWESQVNLFREAVKLSPHGGIDAVVANAGIGDAPPPFELPKDLDVGMPPPPKMRVLDVNLTGVLYTSHLALFYLPKNPDSKAADPESSPSSTTRDRHLILMGSVASLCPIPSATLYGISKHAVLGLFRNLRSTAFTKGIRVNMLCPYFIDTPLLSTQARMILAGSAMGKVEDVAEAASRLMADTRIVGRAMVIGRKLKTKQQKDGTWVLVQDPNAPGTETAIWEAYADDFEDSDVFMRHIVVLMNQVTMLKGWIGWLKDMIAAVAFSIRGKSK